MYAKVVFFFLLGPVLIIGTEMDQNFFFPSQVIMHSDCGLSKMVMYNRCALSLIRGLNRANYVKK